MASPELQDPRFVEPRPPFARQRQAPPGRELEMEPVPDAGEHTYVGHGRLAGRVALITGGDSGIGRAVAIAFAREGADVALSYLEEHEDAEYTAHVVAQAGRRALLLPGDVADAAHCRQVVERTVAQLGRLDILVNNAAFQGFEVEGPEALDDARLERTFQVNILAMFRLVRAALPHLKPGSSILNVSSIEAYRPSPSILDYSTTKGAIVTFSKGLAHALIERGIRVNVVAPGAVWTPLVVQGSGPGSVSTFGGDAPIGRPAQPAELAPAFVFLASDASRYVTGEVLGVTGGLVLP